MKTLNEKKKTLTENEEIVRQLQQKLNAIKQEKGEEIEKLNLEVKFQMDQQQKSEISKQKLYSELEILKNELQDHNSLEHLLKQQNELKLETTTQEAELEKNLKEISEKIQLLTKQNSESQSELDTLQNNLSELTITVCFINIIK